MFEEIRDRRVASPRNPRPAWPAAILAGPCAGLVGRLVWPRRVGRPTGIDKRMVLSVIS